MKYTVTITIRLKEGMLNPEARAIQHALKNLGFQTEDLSTARLFRITLEAPDAEAARKTARQMCDRLLANPVIHEYTIEVE
ncbi:phosphoribosylformylglycinamidine synthase subunit PurS [Methanoculleus sp.]|jgi:phosphoribosylformylglycinamidine synthase|uniref:phosphoribosylformylglycinamidine synthase subunit PurS n=1 Tax=Methanoculleus sp. TaxID=90427 RepID=UPI002631A3FA|nr:phosphoribosylformylglycinamidine synthase subunit PurS [Methanoculleus sp.]MDI6867699.1 phosphoribosylformylglycinamidine synthase subunit PurS [Methanoculleus sp.]